LSPTRTTSGQRVYALRVEGHLDRHWADWFGDLTITHDADGGSTLVGPVADQAALHGVLAKIRDLGLTLIAVSADPPGGPH
jgi:hypothetical protein